MKLIVRGADYAMTDSITDGCLRAARCGILTDVGLMTNNAAQARYAVNELKKYPHVSVGQDLNLVSGLPASDPKDIPALVDENGIFISSTRQRRKVKDFFIKFKKKSHFADFLTEQTLDFVLHCLLGGLAEMHTDDIGCLADLLSHSRARGTVGCGIVHSKSSCK